MVRGREAFNEKSNGSAPDREALDNTRSSPPEFPAVTLTLAGWRREMNRRKTGRRYWSGRRRIAWSIWPAKDGCGVAVGKGSWQNIHFPLFLPLYKNCRR